MIPSEPMRCFFTSLFCGAGLLLAACHTEPPATARPRRKPVAAPAVVAAPVAAAAGPVAAPPRQPRPSLAAFVPAGYGILDSAVGDLNRDARPDVVLVLRQNGEDTIPDDVPRPLLLLLGQPDHRLALAARNDHAVLHRNWGGNYGDPFAGVVVKHGFFSVEHYGGNVNRWSRTSTFRYQPTARTWFLNRESTGEYEATSEENAPETSRTARDFGQVPFARYDTDSTY